MELPEQDRQALIEAARRRGQGGAAFGVYPSSGKRPEKLNVSRDVNMPAQVARGWVAGTLGLPGDIEGLGRMLINMAPAGQEHERVTGRSFVSETPVLPTSDFYKEWLPGGDERPAAKFASGLGALAGGAGSTTLARGAVKGAKATGKALGPKAAEMAESYLQRSGLAPTVVKPKGGNWLSGSVEGTTRPLKRQGVAVMPLNEEEAADYARRGYTEFDEATGTYSKPNAVDQWIDSKLNKYIKNEMGTPEDPVRKLAERGILHFDPEAMPRYMDDVWAMREKTGFPAMQGTSPLAQKWEAYADQMVRAKQLGEPIRSDKPLGLTMKDYIASEPGGEWALKAPAEQMVYELRRPGTSSSQIVADELGLPHLIDELRNATRADSDLPANLRWKPEDLKKVTMEQAVERVAKINDWRAAQMAAAQRAAREGIPVHKEYEGGFQWMAAPDTAIDPKSLQYIKDVGCEGGWCTQGEDLARQYGGRGNQLYVLHEPSGKPVVQISVRPARGQDKYYTDWVKSQPESVQDEITAAAIKYNAENPKLGYGESLNKILQDRIGPMPPEIVEIKGKQNRAPKEEHLPMVQDFVRSGNWSRVGDLKNTGLIEVGEKSAVGQMLKQAGETNIPPYVTRQEYDQIIERFGLRPGFGLPQGYAKGGLVEDTDAIVAKLTGMDKHKALTHALRMANAKQEAHMQAGGLATLFKGAKAAKAAKAAEEAAAAAKAAKVAKPVEKVSKPAEKAAEAAKPAVKGPQAEALETARKNAVKMLGLPENNTAMDRARALGFDADTYHGTFNRFENFDLSKANPRSQYMPGVFTADDPRLAENFGDYIMPLRQRQGTTVLERRAARLEGSPLPEVDTIHDKSKGIRVTNNPTNIRSRFAAFDPARVNENDLLGAADPALLAGTAVASGIGLGALGQMSKPKPKQEEKKKAAGGLAKRM